MSFSGRKFQFYLIFGDKNENIQPWKKEVWTNIYEPAFFNILKFSGNYDKTGVRVLEYAKKSEKDKYKSEVKLGRLKWDEKSHTKWTLNANDVRDFCHFESWTPIWTTCEKIDKSPDIYISIWNEISADEELKDKKREFSFLITIAIAVDLNVDGEEIIKKLSKEIRAKRTVYNTRNWGRGKYDETETWEFLNWIQDTNTFGIYKKGHTLNIHDTKFEDLKFEPYWKIIH